MAPGSIEVTVAKVEMTNAKAEQDHAKGASLTIDLWETSKGRKMFYLVANLSKDTMDDLRAHLASLPKSKRDKFLDDWVAKSHDAILEEYRNSGPGARTFKVKIAPIPLKEIVPERIPRKPIRSTPSRLPGASRTEDMRAKGIVPEGPSGGSPALGPAPVTEPKGPLKAPLPPKLKGGRGTQSNPYIIEIPVPHTTSGKEIHTTRSFSISKSFTATSMAGPSTYKEYFKLRFVTEKRKAFRTSVYDLGPRVTGFITNKINEFSLGRYGEKRMTGGSVRAITSKVIGQINDAVRNYLLLSGYISMEKKT